MTARTPRIRVQRHPVHGVLLLDKPLHLSSNDALQKAKWLLRAEKAGHTGTLDPLATGVLPLCFGAATKFSQLQLDAPKTYEAIAQLGTTTTTGDAEGDIVQQRAVNAEQLAPEKLAAVQAQFTGTIEQVPPMHSALKKDGKALYEYARAGVAVERAARPVTIHALQIAPLPDGTTLKITVTCSKGTYIRTLGEDIGAALGCGAHLTFLRRIATGGLKVEHCITLAQLEALPENERLGHVLPVDTLLQGHTHITLQAEDAGRFLSGLRRRGPWPDAPLVAVYGPAPSIVVAGGDSLPSPASGRGAGGEGKLLLGTAHTTRGELIPDRLLSPVEIRQILEANTASAALPQ